MPISTLYKVITRYEADTRTAEQRVERLSRKAEKHARLVDRARNAWASFGSIAKTVAVGGLISGLGFVARRMINLTQVAEDAQIQIAAVFEQAKPGNFAKNLDRASDLFKKFQTSAITSPATSQNFMELFQGAAPAIAPLGIPNSVIDQFIARAVPTAKAFTGGDFDQAGRDVLQILQGRAGTDVKTFLPLKAALLKATSTETTEQFNQFAQANPLKVFDALNKSLESMDVVNKKFGSSFGGLLASVQEFADGFLRTLGGPVVGQMAKTLQRMVGWFADNEDAVAEIGESIGNKFAKSLEVAEKITKAILDNFKGIAIVGASIAAKKGFGLASSLGTAALGGADKSELLKQAVFGGGGIKGGGLKGLKFALAGTEFGQAVGANVASARGIAGGTARGIARAPGRLVGGAVSLAGEAIFGGKFGPRQDMLSRGARGAKAMAGRNFGAGATSIFTPLQRAAGALKSGGLGLLVKGLPAIAGAFSTLAAIILPLGVVIGMIAGAFRVLKDNANEATVFFNTSIDELFRAFDMIAIQFGASGGFGKAITDFVDWLGTGVVGVLGIGVKVVEQIARAFSLLFAGLKGFALGVGTIFSTLQTDGVRAAFDPNFVKKAFSSGMKTAFDERKQAEREAFRLQTKKKKDAEDKATADELEKGAKKPPINVTINQTITTDANPDRIAFRIGEVIGDVMRKAPRSVVGIAAR